MLSQRVTGITLILYTNIRGIYIHVVGAADGIRKGIHYLYCVSSSASSGSHFVIFPDKHQKCRLDAFDPMFLASVLHVSNGTILLS